MLLYNWITTAALDWLDVNFCQLAETALFYAWSFSFPRELSWTCSGVEISAMAGAPCLGVWGLSVCCLGTWEDLSCVSQVWLQSAALVCDVFCSSALSTEGMVVMEQPNLGPAEISRSLLSSKKRWGGWCCRFSVALGSVSTEYWTQKGCLVTSEAFFI